MVIWTGTHDFVSKKNSHFDYSMGGDDGVLRVGIDVFIKKLVLHPKAYPL